MKKRPPAKRKRRESRKGPRRPDLAPWQVRAIEIVRASAVPEIGTFGGGAALSAVYLHHRRSADLDFFLSRALQPAELAHLARALAEDGTRVEEQVIGSLTSLILLDRDEPYGKIDLSVHPAPRVEKGTLWNGLIVESRLDMTVNKVGALLNRHQPRDFVDLYFLLKEGPERDLERLLDLLQRVLGVSADPFTLASRFLAVRSVDELPDMIRPIDLETLREFFWEQARELIRK